MRLHHTAPNTTYSSSVGSGGIIGGGVIIGGGISSSSGGGGSGSSGGGSGGSNSNSSSSSAAAAAAAYKAPATVGSFLRGNVSSDPVWRAGLALLPPLGAALQAAPAVAAWYAQRWDAAFRPMLGE